MFVGNVCWRCLLSDVGVNRTCFSYIVQLNSVIKMNLTTLRKQLSPILGSVAAVLLLTLTTQIGGVVYLACLPIFRFFNEKFGRRIIRIALRISVFCLFYCFTTFIIVPPLAEHFGRVPMPSGDDNPHVRELNFIHVLTNRTYVVPQLREVVETAAERLAKVYPEVVVTYLDCGFPFFDGFPLKPHLSHDDGRKIDISFFYTDAATQQPTAERPSWLGYGVCEEPRAGEENRAEFCRAQGAWQYSFMKNYVIPQGKKHDLPFDALRTRDLMRAFLIDNRVQFLLIEAHLKKRLDFERVGKVKIPPCNSVRHDDHLHVAIY